MYRTPLRRRDSNSRTPSQRIQLTRQTRARTRRRIEQAREEAPSTTIGTLATHPAAWPAPGMDLDAIEQLVAQWLDILARVVDATGAPERAARLSSLADTLRPVAGSTVATTDLPSPGRLTNREREVAAWVARGLTNRQIAEELVISERTADTHIQNILGKLGLNSRAQVAAWVVQRIPAPAYAR